MLSIGGTEAIHFQTWHDKAGNAPPLTDPSDSTLVFPDLNAPPLGGFLTAMGLFIGQSAPFFALLRELAEEADAARREGER